MASLGGEQVISSKVLSDTTPQKENRPSTGEKKSFMEHSNSTIHWFAQIGEDNNSNEAAASRDREEKLRLIRERQNEERQKKIEELKAQAEAAQKYREQKEEERRRRIEELRNRDNDRRQQVEERKRAIMEAEKERREYILRKNQERDARLDTKRRNEKSSITFAFGSSTPRLLDPSELGNVSPSAFWGHRRSTSITNVAYTGAPLTRRSSERELSDGSKKRATSAGGIDRQNEDRHRRSTSMYEVFNWGFVNDEPPKRFPLSIAAADIDIDGPPTTTTTTTTTDTNKENVKIVTKEETTDSPTISYRSVYRRKTDLMPTIPSPREPSFGSKSSLHSQAHTPRTPGSRSGEVTPRGSTNTSRPGSAMSNSTTASGFVQKRSTSARKPRPASIAVTGVSQNDEQKQKKEKPPLPKVQSTPKRTNVNHASSRISSADSNKVSEKRSATKRDITPHKMSVSMTQSVEQKVMKHVITKEKQATEKPLVEKNVCDKIDEIKENIVQVSTETAPQTKEEKDALNAVKTEINAPNTNNEVVTVTQKDEQKDAIDNKAEIMVTNSSDQVKEQITEKIDDGSEKDVTIKEDREYMDRSRELSVERQDNEMTASMIARSKITTEEEAKAALAERRRLAREEAERQAELERQRLEEERQAELRRQQEEEEKQRKFEEEALRLAEEQRKAEEERLLQAIEEAKKREIEEKIKKEEEEKLKAEKEENERKAKEEAEKQRLEMAERLKREEKEREERRKRVEAIMSRTRAKGGNSTPNSTPVKENENSKEQNNSNNKESTEMKAANENSASNSQDSKENSNKMVNVEKSSSDEGQQQQQIQQEQQQTQQLQQQQQQQHQHQTTYEQSVTEKENALLKSFNNMIIDENAKNIQNVIQNPFMMMDMTNGKMSQPIQPQLPPQNNQIDEIPTHPMANGNGHIENNINKNVSSATAITDQLIDFSNESQQQQQQLVDVVNFTNNNLLTSNTTQLVTADSHENKEISLL